MSHFLPKRNLSAQEKKLIPEALLYLSRAWYKVKFKAAKKYLPEREHTFKPKNTAEDNENAQRIAQLIVGLGKRTPWSSTCLIQALALHQMLTNRKINHQLHFGIKKISPEKLYAHAWVSVDGKTLIGGENLINFTEIA